MESGEATPDGEPARGPVPRPGRSDESPPARTAAFFDLDKTIIATSSATAFSRPFMAGGLINRRDVLRTAYAQFVYLMGAADADQTERLRAHLSAVAAGWDVAQVSQIVEETLHQYIDPLVYAEAVGLIEEHHEAGRDVVVVSASGAEVVEPIAAMLGADHVVATRMSVVDGRYTGDIDFYAYGENKAVAMREIAEREGYDMAGSYAYSDSITDAPMLAAVGHGYAVNPDRALRRLAVEEGWGTLTFLRPVSLRARLRDGLHPTPRRTAVIVAVVVAVALVLVARASIRRRRPTI